MTAIIVVLGLICTGLILYIWVTVMLHKFVARITRFFNKFK
jgi:hypothetical protein